MTEEKSKQTIANQNWEKKNREYASYLKSRSSARSFIRNKATLEDIEELRNLLKEREGNLKCERE
ncbi:hypothetical protein EXN65_16790 [Clostridium botulinum]|uniref:Uncharacterized protein n=1 Tax=Clostridium botulinum TaxID=1491 RepID=A0A846I478_CLOBO|nr:hypothetical protein [Clostridium botulinum]AJE09650.1 putative nicotinate phosphoribosyltransferase [Clostridium botulinum CDC_1436]AJE10746.1 putative nicotinate phosphoribosyltransferase [Clostridium botulinum CDC_1436]EDT84852.1 nicotinate phosphoribosyltransferase [Clostridium botulinum Bf]MBY6879698.1 hypothetical protein [Clostridium botulinum]MBY6898784.1 hypothetical protein [Clostridium botulinum]